MTGGWIDLDALIETATNLEPLPPSATRLAALVAQPDWELDEIEQVIRLDPALTGRVLRIANSAAHGGIDPVATVREAVLRLGAGAIANIAAAAGARPLLTHPLPPYQAAAGVLWMHSVAAALAVDLLPTTCKMSPPAASATSALLHDLGKLVLCQHLTPKALELVLRARDEASLPLTEAEFEILEVDHAELGALIAQAWKLPAQIVEGIRLHHSPTQATTVPESGVVGAVALGDLVARRLVPGLGERPSDVADEALLGDLGISHVSIERLERAVSERLEAVLQAYA